MSYIRITLDCTKLQDHFFFDAVTFFDVNQKKKLHIFREQSINVSPFCAYLTCLLYYKISVCE